MRMTIVAAVAAGWCACACAEDLKWIDGRDLPIEGRAFDDVANDYDRLPRNVPTNVNKGVHALLHHTAGLQFRFATDSKTLRFRWVPYNAEYRANDNGTTIMTSGIDVYRRKPGGVWKYLKTGRIQSPTGAVCRVDWTPGEECLVNLPLYNGIKSFALGVDANASVSPLPPRKNGVVKPVVFYGTSITQGGSASRPGLAYVNAVGRELDVPVVNLGFSGSGRMEVEMSEYLGRIDAGCFVLDCLWNMSDRLVEERYEPFVRNLRALRPDVPIVMAEQCDVFCKGPSPKDRQVRALYDKLVAQGWKNLHYLPKTEMHEGDFEGTIDGCHPNDLGMRTLAQAFGKALRRVLRLPGAPVEPEDLTALPGAAFRLPNHPRITSFDLMDQTDSHNELLTTREWTSQWNERSFSVATCVLDVQDAETGSGRVFVRLAPLPHARPVKTDDFRVDSLVRTVEVLSNGYPFVTREYRGGRVGRIRALNAIQREIRPYRAGRDGRILSNNWGGGYSDTRLNEEYALREIEAGAKLGVEVIELDDGWQKGRSANSLLIKDRAKDGVWNGYWAFDPNFWDADPVRFSHGLAPLVAAAKAHGMDFGLWFGPDSSNDAANWERDADRLLAYYRDPGIRYFKIDSMKSFSPLALRRQRAMFDKMLAESSSNIVFDLDVTAEIRPGYFGLPDIGTLFVENRYAKHCSWWPHQTLRNLWSLSEVVDPVRLRMEFLDPKQHADRYAERFPGSPLRPELWTGDAVFATVMLSSPLCWMEIQGLQSETVAEMAPLIATWKRERDRLHEGVTFPIGAKPDGFSWTGFVTSAADGRGGYALIFRECAKESSFTFDLSPYLAGSTVETLSGTGAAASDGTCLRVEIPEKLGYLWLKLK